jgi:hypothetical protein
MARRLVVQLQSDLDIQAAAVWYEDQRDGLGLRFLNELDLVFQRIEANSRQFPRLEGEVHVLHRGVRDHHSSGGSVSAPRA